MKRIQIWLGILVVALLSVAAGAAAQRLGSGSAAAMAEFAKKIDEMPDHVGDWELQSKEQIVGEEARMLECAGSTHRVYRHRQTGKTVNMFVIVGPPGPTAVHNPEICYSGNGFEINGEPELISIDCGPNGKHDFRVVSLTSGNAAKNRIKVTHAWNSGDGWQVPAYPRFAFGGKPLLFKLQLATSEQGDAADAEETSRAFLGAFLPVLQGVLFHS